VVNIKCEIQLDESLESSAR